MYDEDGRRNRDRDREEFYSARRVTTSNRDNLVIFLTLPSTRAPAAYAYKRHRQRGGSAENRNFCWTSFSLEQGGQLHSPARAEFRWSTRVESAARRRRRRSVKLFSPRPNGWALCDRSPSALLRHQGGLARLLRPSNWKAHNRYKKMFCLSYDLVQPKPSREMRRRRKRANKLSKLQSLHTQPILLAARCWQGSVASLVGSRFRLPHRILECSRMCQGCRSARRFSTSARKPITQLTPLGSPQIRRTLPLTTQPTNGWVHCQPGRVDPAQRASIMGCF